MVARPAAGGGRWVEVGQDRLARWVDGFQQRHGTATADLAGTVLRLEASDGSVADLHPLPGMSPTGQLAQFLTEVSVPRRVGLVLARQGSIAVGIAVGDDLVESKVDSSYVQGRTAAGGWSQQRFARRRANQARFAASNAADLVARLLLPALAQLDAVVTGGDRRALDAVFSDPRLAPIAALRADRVLDVAEPKLAVLQQSAIRARSVLVRVDEPAR